MKPEIYNAYVKILHEELVPAMGCTEPIAIAYASALARDTLGTMPERMEVQASGNLIKNVKSVVVPNTNGLKGIEAAVAAGVVAGDAGKALEVISVVSGEQKARIHDMVGRGVCKVSLLDSGLVLDLIVTLRAGDDWARVRIVNHHTDVVLIEKNGAVLLEKPVDTSSSIGEVSPEKRLLTIRDIVEFARTVDLDDVRDVLERQVNYNMAICEEGLKSSYGGNVGKVLLREFGDGVATRCKAKAAAGSDARMGGCELPVVINSGSGNQGITVSVPVVEYARELGKDQDTLLRALVISNLVAVHQKAGIGSLSAYCGAISAGAAAGAAIAFLLGGGEYEIEHTIVNCLAISSGVVCDGAKASCAGKIAIGLDAALLGYQMIKNQQQFRGGDGILKKGVEETIGVVGRLGKDGMRETDREILHIMID
ncbi:L-serine ammonia-lyase, iron-sulfur-dependent, subunit alpha [Intestinimonas butyriciproducens]|nr:L-serine ammonia-lyase, iron-sulfur-dependent, subunit alpha [Intestinimonas butyriciproducens]MCB7050320.1 L-serine ammonia-lyase, iron-sulfur-dependent, subunit alpha [Intestinimonas butyriciproducens]MDB7817180.1 L-serine ammonia-lyase, iron-sulfur-dependent, subunit alpha [Intestinimonas butyriciproducens]MDB7843724.1 L-serine ammonia-lyase, iron-sulfur-dependent, subunit alpha [Intestinimonas butyriciproducens]MDB7858204.1 L-serine ammonia-lyase, iron-sulfur-dependent, subunit alpha [In